jgi:hypothetical protein
MFTAALLLRCRFGAEDLFKAAEEGSAERSKRLLEEDIDAILQRAEVVEQGPGAVDAPANEVAAELLSSFNVATFKVSRAETLSYVQRYLGEMWLTELACLTAGWMPRGGILISSTTQCG